jgi:hypothetical protein
MRWAAALVVAVLVGLAVLSWQAHDVSAQAPAALADHGTARMQQEPQVHTHLTTLGVGVGAVVLALQLFLVHRYQHTSNRVVLTAAALIAILICTRALCDRPSRATHALAEARVPRSSAAAGPPGGSELRAASLVAAGVATRITEPSATGRGNACLSATPRAWRTLLVHALPGRHPACHQPGER